ncbi:C1 family peptidase [Algibacter sp. Ld11]|uniref:C1 family peptidase n=1 Tax=Algibacter sp. Ld11 TaxID=649150 RepID=UPI003869DD07
MSKGENNLKAIQGAIKEDGAEWQAGSSEILEMDDQEQDLRLGYVPGDNEPSLKEKEEAAKINLQEYLASSSSDAFGAPTSYDLRNVGGKNFITAVKNQGSCGSCVSFGAVATVEGTLRRLKNNPNLNVDLSEAHLFYCHARSEGRNCGNGWWVTPAMNAFKSKGVTDETHYPYTSVDQNCTGLRSGWESALMKISGFKKITSIAQMKTWLSTKGPLTACFTVYSDFFGYRSGVYRKTAAATNRGGHCVTMVGYSDSGRYWICKNSWGTNWGDNGYFKIAYGEVGIDNEVWGVEGIVDTGWVTAKVTGLWANQAPKNAFVHIVGEGWKRISPKSETTFYIMLTQLAAAKGANKNVRVYKNNGVIVEVYVL